MVKGLDLPRFSDFSVNTLVDRVKAQINICRQTIEEVVASGDFSFANVVSRVEEVDDQLSKIWSPASHLNGVVNTPELRAAHDACLPLLSDYATWVGQHEGLFGAYNALKNSHEFSTLATEQQTAVDNALRDFSLSGIALAPQQQQRFAQISSRLSELASLFGNNLLDATMGWYKQVLLEEQLRGLPEYAIQQAAQTAAEKGVEGWVFTLDIPSYLAVMMYADDADLRQEMYGAYVTRASDQGPNAGKWDNSSIIDEILRLREEKARLLGFTHFAELSLATKMAESVDKVMAFMRELTHYSRPQAMRELDELRAFAQQHYGLTELNSWDVAYFSEKLKQQRFSVSDEVLKPYFPENTVLNGLFSIVNRLFGLRVVEDRSVDVWHKDVKFFEIYDSVDELRGGFYLDLYARDNKRGGAWMDVCQVRRLLRSGDVQLPVAYLVCNFSRPVGDKPALLTHNEVVTLFHEFGHGLHHMLTKVNTAAVSGISGVAWDAVELPSQFLENWCWQAESLRTISGHYNTGEPLPESDLTNMLAARDFQSAMQMLRQLEFSLFDFELHQVPAADVDVQALLTRIRAEVAVLHPPAFNRFQHSFSHIFAGGYAAGYYSYKWAEVLSADAFSRFEEEGLFNPHVGQAFLSSVLERGGSQPAMKLFVDFRGREPQVEALLRHNGIAVTKAA